VSLDLSNHNVHTSMVVRDSVRRYIADSSFSNLVH
jgi:hypothetical protein